MEESIAALPTKAYDPRYDGGFVNGDQFAEAVYRSLADAQ